MTQVMEKTLIPFKLVITDLEGVLGFLIRPKRFFRGENSISIWSVPLSEKSIP